MMVPKKPILFCLVYQGVFGHCPTILDYFRRSPKTKEDSRRSPKNFKNQRRCPKTVEDVQRQPKISEEKSGKFFKSRQELAMLKDNGFLFFTKTLQTLDSSCTVVTIYSVPWFTTTVKGTFGVKAGGIVATIVRADLAFVYV